MHFTLTTLCKGVNLQLFIPRGLRFSLNLFLPLPIKSLKYNLFLVHGDYSVNSMLR